MRQRVWALVVAVACGSSDEGSPDAAQPDAAGGGLRVEGRIVSVPYGLPLPYMRAWVDGRVVNADAEGRFVVDGVDPPYDAAAINPYTPAAVLYVGLTRPDPTLELYGLPEAHQATIEGALSGGDGFPSTSLHQTGILFLGESGFGSIYPGGLFGPAYQLPIELYGEASADGILCVVQRHLEGSAETEGFVAVAYAEMPLTVTADATITGVDLALSPVGRSTLSAEVTVPAGWTTTTAMVSAEGTCEVTNDQLLSGVTAFSIVSPVVDGRTVRLRVEAYGPEASGLIPVSSVWTSGLAPEATGVALALPDPPVIVQPAELASMNGTFFEWSGGPDALQLAFFGGGDGRTLVVVTADRFFRMPDLSDAGFAFASTVTWSVRQSPGYLTTDEATGPDGGRAITLEAIRGRAPNGAYSLSQVGHVTP